NDDHGLAQNQRGQLVAQRFAAAGGHYYRHIVAVEQAVYDALLQRAKGIVAPIAPQRAVKVPWLVQPLPLDDWPQRPRIDVSESYRPMIALEHDRILARFRNLQGRERRSMDLDIVW